MQVDRDYHENLTREGVDRILNRLPRELDAMLKRTGLSDPHVRQAPGLDAGGAYERDLGGYQVARRALTTMTREQVVDEAKKAKIRGRVAGAGFPMGVKWSFMPKAAGPPSPTTWS